MDQPPPHLALSPGPLPAPARPVGPATTLLRFSTVAWRASPAGAVGDVALTVLQGIVPAGVLWAARGLVNAIAAMVAGQAPRALAPLLPWAAALIALGLVTSLAETAQGALTAFLKPRINLILERTLLEASARIELVRFEQPEVHDQLQRARGALGYRLTNLLQFLAEIGQAAVMLAAYGVLLGLADPWLLAAVVLPAIPSTWLKVRAARSGYIHDYDATPVRRLMGYLRGLLLGGGTGQEVRVFALGPHLWERWGGAHARWWAESRGKARTEALSALGTTAAQVAAYAVAIVILAALITGRRLDIGDYVVLTGAAAAFQGELEGLLWTVRHVLQDLPHLRDLQEFLDQAAAASARAGRSPFPRPLRQGLVVQGLRFRYPGASVDTLREISFQVRPGETIAIVGANGAGKSTLIKLLLGLYAPAAGSVRYDGVEVGALDPAGLAANCAAVFQDLARFRRPVREELAPGDAGLQADDAALWTAAAAAGVAERLRSLPRGLDTFLDPSLVEEGAGAELSGGEWQKLAIARALARRAQVLVLDEPAAALDPAAEVELYAGFAALARGRMTFLISHRIGSARLADRILVLQEGRIAEEGSHDGLLAAGGLYARFFEAQARWYRPAPQGGAAQGGEAGA